MYLEAPPSSFMRMFRISNMFYQKISSLSDYSYQYVLEKFRFMFCGLNTGTENQTVESDRFTRFCSK